MSFSGRFELRCPQCGKTDLFTADELYQRLREKGFLRRHDEPSPELLREIVQSCVANGNWDPCSQCGANRPISAVAQPKDDAADPAWGDTVYCESCRAAIPSERLELFPDSRLCMACQKKVEKGGGTNDAEYCPHCGDLLQTKLVSRGVSAYRRYCPSCRKTF